MFKQTRKSKKAKAPQFTAGKLALFTVSSAIGAFCVAGWLNADGDIWQRYLPAALALASALVIPFTVGALGRSWSSAALLLPVTLALLFSAYSFHNAADVLIEAPRREVHAASLVTLESDLAAAKAARAALTAPLYVAPPCNSFCTNPIKAAQATWQAQRDAYEADVKSADAAVTKAQAALDAAVLPPLVPGWLVGLAGGLFDLGVAVGIWALEATGRRLEVAAIAKADADKAHRQREKASREKQLNKKAATNKTPAKKPSDVLSAAEIAAFNLGGGLRVVRG